MLFLPNPHLPADLMADEEFRQGLVESEQMAEAKQLAETYAPKIMPRPGAPERIVATQDEDGVSLVNTDYGGHLAEWGSKNNPPLAPLRRAALGAGFRVEESPKG